jgi:hypothetical protein
VTAPSQANGMESAATVRKNLSGDLCGEARDSGEPALIGGGNGGIYVLLRSVLPSIYSVALSVLCLTDQPIGRVHHCASGGLYPGVSTTAQIGTIGRSFVVF